MEEFSIFTESNEDMGLLYDSYKDIGKTVEGFLSIVEAHINVFLKDPKNTDADLREAITKFKASVDKSFTPSPINISTINSTKASIKKYRSYIEGILERYAKARDKMSFGGNLVRSIILKPKAYSSEIDPEVYSRNNKNIRNIDRALDWVEKVIIDIFNLIDQDLNILTIVGRVYGKKKIYESTSIFQSGDFDEYKQFYKEEDHKDDLLNTSLDSHITEASDDPPPNMPGQEGDENNEQTSSNSEGSGDAPQTSDVPPEDSEVHEEPAGGEEQPKEEVKKESMPKKTDTAESSKNGVRRKKLYVAFIEWAKEYNSKNTFGSIFDKDIFHNVYPFVPDEMRYFYRLANPILCVLGGDLTFFQVSELKKLNAKNSEMDKLLIFAATPNDLRVFNKEDKRVYIGTENNGKIELGESIGDTFDLYLQKMIKKGDILNGPIEDESAE